MRKKHVLMVVLAALLLVALWRVDHGQLRESIRHTPLWTVGLLLALQVLSQLLVNAQWCAAARLAGMPVLFWDMLYINSQGAVVDAITPGVKLGGEVTRAVQISRVSGYPGAQSAALVALQKLFSLSALFVVLLGTLGYLTQMLSWFFALPVVCFLLVFAAIFAMPRQMKAYIQNKKAPRFPWMGKVRGFLLTWLDQVVCVRGQKGALELFLLSLLIWALYPVKLYLLVGQFAPVLGIFPVAAVTFAAYMVGMLPIFPGGLGGFEGTMAGLLAAAGMAVSDGAVVTVFFRFVTFWFVVLLSLAYIGVYRLLLRYHRASP